MKWNIHVAFAIWWKLFSKSEHKPSSHSGHHWSACFVIYWASRIPHIIVRDVVIFTYKRIKKDIPMELNFGTDIENTGIIIYVLAIFHFICYFMLCELSLFSTQCQLNVVIILRSCISVGIVVFSWLYQVCCLFLFYLALLLCMNKVRHGGFFVRSIFRTSISVPKLSSIGISFLILL
jgi:hypothetical protein